MNRPVLARLLSLALAALLCGCTSLRATRSEEADRTQPLAQAGADPAGTAQALTRQDTPASLPSLLLVSVGSEGLRAQPVDPHTLDALPGYTPFELQHHYVHAVSPDGRTLAAITWPGGAGSGGMLHLLDLASWTDQTPGVTIDDQVDTLTFSQDGKELYWARPTRHDPAHGMPRAYELYRYDLGSRTVSVVTKLPPTFIPWWKETHLLASGERLAIYGIPVDANDLSEDAPHVLIVNLNAGRIAVDIRLDGVRAGQFRDEQASGAAPGYRMYTPGLAWDRVRDLLYVVHADADRVTVVDLAQGAVLKQAEVRPKLSLWERAGGWLVGVAEAKMIPGTERRVALSLDGTRLYAVGLRAEAAQQADGTWIGGETPLGLQLIATDDLSELRRLDLPVSDVALSPDGRRLLLSGAQERSRSGSAAERTGNGLYLLDADRLEQLAHLQPGVEYSIQGFSPDSRYAYLTYSVSSQSGGCGDQKAVYQTLELPSGRVVAAHESPGCFMGEVLTIGTARRWRIKYR